MTRFYHNPLRDERPRARLARTMIELKFEGIRVKSVRDPSIHTVIRSPAALAEYAAMSLRRP